ncbi:MAG: tRNA (adenosine(37)-N6)-threonylcarbamoyltransferase complex ATPase subunit type 1 TsaE [Proteobacteria bacterium]|nr:tRNA (adenosine(37)-N6)-threonylcarbamoyltransferase complex ATPase subunit type 1 TsaE [Pseudomonadota bacterium]MBU1138934.1 tRNA (adenosine(37)-N6)-threonylcarbamoyltransferase complex ATPase subunit type 1 TsaE [Pseudomonadota bacterium]MBU1417071.1 tRNA (adenosine(37)-N6)-threonylcarbamoyltransferase complex ATPase subunit type 1 TsaE [Pseudomonadota bacterium]MBU1453767.1 tRNA (adenosine(37)-N6)-threonylcarbamoyltransferase complex ATPase subunit type 1 TsaE [Pseudomonadota bacterium]
MESFVFVLKNLEETEMFGRHLGTQARPGDIICLSGDLGAGKTALTQKIAKGLGVPDSCYVTSPSFSILQEYPGRIPLYHMDFYRLGDETEVEDLGFEEFFYLSGLTVIEWSERAGALIPATRLFIRLTINDDLSRRVEIDFGCGTWQERLHHFCEAVSAGRG